MQKQIGTNTMPITATRIHDELQFKNHSDEFIRAMDLNNAANYKDPKAQDDMEIFNVAVMSYSFLLPSLKETSLEDWADDIELRYNSPQAYEVAGVLRKFSEKYSA